MLFTGFFVGVNNPGGSSPALVPNSLPTHAGESFADRMKNRAQSTSVAKMGNTEPVLRKVL